MNETSNYTPGVCNINRDEVAYRRKAMWVGVGIAVVGLVLLLAFGAHPLLRLVLFVPIFIAAIGYLQVKNSFCVSYAASGKQNATDGDTTASEVTDANARATDKAKAKSMNTQAFAASIIITALLLLIPNL